MVFFIFLSNGWKLRAWRAGDEVAGWLFCLQSLENYFASKSFCLKNGWLKILLILSKVCVRPCLFVAY